MAMSSNAGASNSTPVPKDIQLADGQRLTSHKITLSTTLMMSEVISGK
jgi:hypothetical protein